VACCTSGGSEVTVDIALDEADGTTPGFVIASYWEDDHEETNVLLNEDRAQ